MFWKGDHERWLKHLTPKSWYTPCIKQVHSMQIIWSFSQTYCACGKCASWMASEINIYNSFCWFYFLKFYNWEAHLGLSPHFNIFTLRHGYDNIFLCVIWAFWCVTQTLTFFFQLGKTWRPHINTQNSQYSGLGSWSPRKFAKAKLLRVCPFQK